MSFFFSSQQKSGTNNTKRSRQVDALRANFHELKSVPGDESSYFLPIQAAIIPHKEPEFMRLQIHLPHDFPEKSGPVLFFPPTLPNRAQIIHKLVDSKTGMVIASDSIAKWNEMSNLGTYVQSVLEQFMYPFEQPKFSGTLSTNTGGGGGGGGGGITTINSSSGGGGGGGGIPGKATTNLNNHTYLSSQTQGQSPQGPILAPYQISQNGTSTRPNSSPNPNYTSSVNSLSGSSTFPSSMGASTKTQTNTAVATIPPRPKTVIPPIPVSFPQLASIELDELQKLDVQEEMREALLNEMSVIKEMKSQLISAETKLKKIAEGNIVLERQIQEQVEPLEVAKRQAVTSSEMLNALIARQLDVLSHFSPDPLAHSLDAIADELEKKSEDSASHLVANALSVGSTTAAGIVEPSRLRDTLKEIETLRTRMHLARIKALVLSQHGIVS